MRPCYFDFQYKPPDIEEKATMSLTQLAIRSRLVSILLVTLSTLAAGNAFAQSSPPADLRKMVLELDPEDIGLSRDRFKHPVWGLLMETGFDEGYITLISLAEGTTSLYFSNGGGIIGAGEHRSVRDAAGYFLSGAQYFFDKATAVDSYPAPAAGEVKFYFLAFDGIYAYTAPEQRLGEGKDILSNLFFAGHELIGEVRKIEQAE